MSASDTRIASEAHRLGLDAAARTYVAEVERLAALVYGEAGADLSRWGAHERGAIVVQSGLTGLLNAIPDCPMSRRVFGVGVALGSLISQSGPGGGEALMGCVSRGIAGGLAMASAIFKSKGSA